MAKLDVAIHGKTDVAINGKTGCRVTATQAVEGSAFAEAPVVRKPLSVLFTAASVREKAGQRRLEHYNDLRNKGSSTQTRQEHAEARRSFNRLGTDESFNLQSASSTMTLSLTRRQILQWSLATPLG